MPGLTRIRLLFLALFVCAALAPGWEDEPVRLGAGEHTYEWVPGWGARDGGQWLGKTHGGVVVDSRGRIYLNTDTERAVCVLAPDGTLLKTWGAQLAGGLHGMRLMREGSQEFLYLTHTGRHEVLKTTLEGEVLWTLGYPEQSDLYASAEQYRPTSVALAPNGEMYVADGYGLGWVHRYDAERRYVSSFGGPGTERGRFRRPHGIWCDTRREPPQLIVCDRENGRLQMFDLSGKYLALVQGDFLRRPCKVFERNGELVVADLAGRITILNDANELVLHLGESPDPSRWGRFNTSAEQWTEGEFIAPHSATWTPEGDLIVVDWNILGRVSRLRRVAEGR